MTEIRDVDIWYALGDQFVSLASQSECDASGTPVIVTRVHLQFEKQMYKVYDTHDLYLQIMVSIYNYAHRYVLMLTNKCSVYTAELSAVNFTVFNILKLYSQLTYMGKQPVLDSEPCWDKRKRDGR